MNVDTCALVGPCLVFRIPTNNSVLRRDHNFKSQSSCSCIDYRVTLIRLSWWRPCLGPCDSERTAPERRTRAPASPPPLPRPRCRHPKRCHSVPTCHTCVGRTSRCERNAIDRESDAIQTSLETQRLSGAFSMLGCFLNGIVQGARGFSERGPAGQRVADDWSIDTVLSPAPNGHTCC